MNKNRLCYGMLHSNLICIKQLKRNFTFSLICIFLQKVFYHDKRDKFNELFDQYYLPLLKEIDHTELILKRKKNIDDASYEKNLNKDI